MRATLLMLSLALVLLASMPHAQRAPSDEEKEKMRVRIGITRDQQKQIEALYRETDRQRQEISAKMRDLYQQLYTLYDAYDFDRNRAKAIRKEIVELQRRRLMLHAENEEKLRTILNREQFDRLRALMKEHWEQRRREWNRPHPNGDKRSSEQHPGGSAEECLSCEMGL